VQAKAALEKALPDIRQPDRRAHVNLLLAVDAVGPGLVLDVPDDLAGDDLAEHVITAFPSLGHSFKSTNASQAQR